MAIIGVKLTGTTDTSGDATITSSNSYVGFLYAVQWIDGTLADGVDAVLSVTTAADGGVAQTLLTLTDANNDAWYYPRVQVHDNTGTGVTYNGTDEIYAAQALINGPLSLVISSGGNAATGGCIVYLEDM